ncbi:uncharacterized protein LOC100902414 [Galendromus occidentalis]|uniref:Uncharacterized protein LOC100902414 n=1 Tax=Galendromus occidentalis TaxID=34638 RepID=A0AAJ6QU23_9ACAR|nr:uncharacterized protein LOC100902414 [Galendromus occidentalis]
MTFSSCFRDSRMLVWRRSCSVWTIALMLITWASHGVADCNCKKVGAPSSPKTLSRASRSTVEVPSAEKLASRFGLGPVADGHWRQEQKQEDGSVRGRYGYTDPSGLVKIVEYFADDSGFHVLHVKTQAPKHQVDSDIHHDTFSPFLGVVPPFVARSRNQHQPDRMDFPINEI